MEPFIYETAPARVVFGSGTLKQLPEEVDRLGKKVLVLTTPPQAAQGKEIQELLGDRAVGLFTEAAMHTPVEVTQQALAVAKELGAEATVAIGGGSTIGLGKALSLHADMPQIAIPTTYAGSEMTPIIGQTEAGRKTTQKTDKVRPVTVVYDLDLTMTLPAGMSAMSGLNAIAHAVEALYAKDKNPIISMMAEDGIRALGQALPVILEKPDDVDARYNALYGAWLCGVCLGSVGMSLHHKLCHTIGGSFNLGHAETHSVVLPYAAAYNAPNAEEAMMRIARALGGDSGPGALRALSEKIGAPTALKDIGMPEDGIDKAADYAAENPYWNPRPVEREAIRDLIAKAWEGAPPV
jgi:alcohol dehydrogenase class IV